MGGAGALDTTAGQRYFYFSFIA